LESGVSAEAGCALANDEGQASGATPPSRPLVARRSMAKRNRLSLLEMRLDHCVIHVSERARSNAFYRDVLGAELVGDSDGVAMYRFGRQQLNVHGPGLTPDPVARLPVQPGGSDLCFVWPGSIDGAIDHLRRHGVEVELGPMRRSGARGEGTSVYFRDPDGSLFELISYA
jgi:catechol 2,3-dioxygenase-like lactoylglutathione lyase family enzyme